MHQKNTKTNTKTIHEPVLLEHVLSTLKPKQGDTYLDLTAGYGGHAAAILQKTGFAPTTLVDRDMNAIKVLREKFSGNPVEIMHSDFHAASRELVAQKQSFALILADLGVSSPHLDNASRGFSIATDGPLDMRMDEASALSAYDIVNNYDAEALRDILVRYGEEPRAGKITRLIVEHRPIKTTTELATIVARAWPGHSRVHPATRTFQAIRIAVNDELTQLERSLPLWVDLLAPGGRLAVISFHSLEDRIVKQYFKEHADSYDAELVSLTHKPVVADAHEIAFNPRARSAKLRAVAKINII